MVVLTANDLQISSFFFSRKHLCIFNSDVLECQLWWQWKQQASWVVLNKRKPRSLFLKLSAFTLFNGFTYSHLSPHFYGLWRCPGILCGRKTQKKTPGLPSGQPCLSLPASQGWALAGGLKHKGSSESIGWREENSGSKFPSALLACSWDYS